MYPSLLLAPAAISLVTAQSTYSPSNLASSLEFTQPSSSLPFPDTSAVSTYANTTGNATARYIRREWDLYNERIQWGQSDLQFVQDPAGGSGEDDELVLRVDYPQGSYSHATGGTQFYVSFPGDDPTSHDHNTFHSS
jgi:hypothetical protein